ncbi:MAG TPA: pyridoxine 5'-phosphate synthase [Gemmatimonadaceae bacterium]|jgi:pyridoxine 5-phosphate synthase
MAARHLRLYVNVDHVATLRQARRGDEPDPVEAAALCERAGADGITAHLREDRRHIQDADVERLATNVRTYFNLESACVPEMISIALRLRPQQVTLVPERRQEVTTEGGLAVVARPQAVRDSVSRLRTAGIRTSLFIDPDDEAVRASRDLDAEAIELHTGEYSRATDRSAALDAIRKAARLGRELGLAVHAGHGLTVDNVGPVAAITEIEELNIGHSIVSRAVFVGLEAAVREIREAMDAARDSVRGAA